MKSKIYRARTITGENETLLDHKNQFFMMYSMNSEIFLHFFAGIIAVRAY
jgi:hypothetical protein